MEPLPIPDFSGSSAEKILEHFLGMDKNVPGTVEAMASCFSAHCRPESESILMGSLSNETSFMESLFKVKSRYDQLLNTSPELREHPAMDKMVAADFGYFMSLNPKAPEHFSRYADIQMRKIRGLHDKTVKEVNGILDETFFFLPYIGDKDILEYFLKRYLAKRLLFMSSSPNNIECEKGLIKRIENKSGNQFTKNMNFMMQDNEDISGEFVEHKYAFEFGIRVLKSGNQIWPYSSRVSSISLPTEFFAAFNNFHSKYSEKYSHGYAGLTLQPALGSCLIDAVFYDSEEAEEPDKKKKKTTANQSDDGTRHHMLTVSTFQMCVLMLFNDKPKLAYKDILTGTKIPKLELDCVLRSLSAGTLSRQVLLNETKGEESIFLVNDQYFRSKRFNVKVQNPELPCMYGPEKKPGLPDAVTDNRNLLIDASVVRILKSCQQLEYDLLVGKVISQLKERFIPTPDDINVRIERLIEREFLIRNDENDKYVYKK